MSSSLRPGAGGARLRADEAHVSDSAQIAADVTLGPGAVVYGDAEIGAGSSVGAGSVIHGGVRIGQRCLIEEGAVLGKVPRLRAGSRARGEVGPLIVGDAVTVCCGAVVYAGAQIGEQVIIGDQAHVRERAFIGASTVVGRGSTVDFAARVGARVSIQTLVYVCAGAVVEDDVFIGPGAISTNDDTMGRHPSSDPLRGPVLRRGCRIGAGAVLTPGTVVGEEAFVAAGAVVTSDVAARAVVMGVPGREVRRVGEEDLLERWR
jgi:UDP-2-acetamido-3-amino-2,3-dideoxy-glucuronate N-acetyltransferase